VFNTLEEVIIRKLNNELVPSMTKTLEAAQTFVSPEDFNKIKKQFEITQYKADEVINKISNWDKSLALNQQ